MITVGDQIFALNQEVKQLKRQCQRYEQALQDIATEASQNQSGGQKSASLAKQALTPALPGKASGMA